MNRSGEALKTCSMLSEGTRPSLILAVADVVESMVSHRPYRPALGMQVALEEIEKNKGILYDVEVANTCIRLFREKGFRFEPTAS